MADSGDFVTFVQFFLILGFCISHWLSLYQRTKYLRKYVPGKWKPKKMESYKFNRRIFLKHYFTQRQKAAAVSWKYSKISVEYIPPKRSPFTSFACLSHFLMCQVNHFLLTLSKGGRNLQIRTRNGENTKHDFEEIRPAQFLPPHSLHPFSPNIGQSSEKGWFCNPPVEKFPRESF